MPSSPPFGAMRNTRRRLGGAEGGAREFFFGTAAPKIYFLLMCRPAHATVSLGRERDSEEMPIPSAFLTRLVAGSDRAESARDAHAAVAPRRSKRCARVTP